MSSAGGENARILVLWETLCTFPLSLLLVKATFSLAISHFWNIAVVYVMQPVTVFYSSLSIIGE